MWNYFETKRVVPVTVVLSSALLLSATQGTSAQVGVKSPSGPGPSGLVAQQSIQISPPLPIDPEAKDTKSYQYIKLRNMSPRMMAWWIDPKHNPVPLGFNEKTDDVDENAKELGANNGQMALPNKAAPLFDLPEGIESIVAVDPQDVLLAYGTTAGLNHLRFVIDYLDKPLRQIEVEAQYVAMTVQDAQELGIERLNTQRIDNAYMSELGLLRRDYRRILDHLIQQNRAKVISSPRVTAINNASARIVTSLKTPVYISINPQGGEPPVSSTASSLKRENQFYVASQSGLRVTPTINNDETITLRMNPYIKLALTKEGVSTSIPLSTPSSINATAIVRDGDTIWLSGLNVNSIKMGNQQLPSPWSNLSSPSANGRYTATTPAANDKGDKRELFLLVTPRIVRRADDFTDNRSEEQRKDPLFLPYPMHMHRKTNTQSPVQP
ncbi:MAG: hypothetical protein JO316_04130 [Abitibacteriaceae bacterium]|nr:hypothetical protein [Abditibacteriaceae bacterium]